MKSRMIAALCAACLLLVGCAPVVNSERDEIRLYDWESELDNGSTVSLCFEKSSASFHIDNNDYSLSVEGLCSISDDNFVIFDSESGMNYSFDYTLHGDCIELSYRGDTIRLEKKSKNRLANRDRI